MKQQSPVKFRSQRGTFEDSMKTVQEVHYLSDIMSILRDSGIPVGDVSQISVEYYFHDPRHPDWHNTHLVSVSDMAVGFTTGKIPREVHEQV